MNKYTCAALALQTKWQYLEGIFVGSEDIRQQLPEEAKRFGLVDKEWRAIMASTAKNPNVIDSCCETGRLDVLHSLGERLDHCQKSLSEYLNTKRNGGLSATSLDRPSSHVGLCSRSLPSFFLHRR